MLFGSLLAKLRPRQPANSITNYHQGELFTPGAMAMVYEPAFTTPLVALIGVGTEYRASIEPIGPAQHFIPAPLGLVRGQRNALGDWESTGPLEV